MDMIFALIGVVGTFLAVYQTATLNESKKRKAEMQYLLVSIGQVALAKQRAWNNQIGLLDKEQQASDVHKSHQQALDDMKEVYALTLALEGVIDSEGSATDRMNEKTVQTAKLTKELKTL